MNSQNSKKNNILIKKTKKHLTNSTSKISNNFEDEDNSNESSIKKLFTKKTKKNNNIKNDDENYEKETNNINNKPLLTDINTQEKTKTKIKKNLQSFEPIIVEHKSEMKPMIKIPKRFIAKKKSIKFIIIFIFRRNQYLINDLKKTSTILDLKNSISKQININQNNFELYFKEKLISNEFNNETISSIINDEKFFFFEVKKIMPYSSVLSVLYHKNYNNKIIVENVNELTELYKVIEQFFKDCLITQDFICEPINDNNYSIGFAYPDLAFDFNRYLFVLKISDEKFKDIKITMKLEKIRKSKSPLSRNYLLSKGKKSYNSALYVGLSGLYMSYEERKRKEDLQNKKKWIDQRGFKNFVNSHRDYNNYDY